MINTLKQQLDRLKGLAIHYQGNEYIVRSWYVLDGQVNITTDTSTIRFDKSESEKHIKDLYQGAGLRLHKNGTPPKNSPASSGRTVQFEELGGGGEKPAGHFYSTREYDKFIFVDSNRPVNKTHVSNLMGSIAKNDLLSSQPILVNEKWEIIDGQHRLCAARNLGRAIYYIRQPGLTIEDAIDLNINTKNWGYADYCEYWISQGNPEYVYLKKFRERYSIPWTLAIVMLHFGETANQLSAKKVFESGEFQVRFMKTAEFIGRITLLCSRYGSFANDRSFIRALGITLKNERLDPWLFLHKLSLAPDKFRKCSDTDSYLRMMEEVINHHSRGERIRLY